MGTGIYFPIAALPFSILLIILFFLKKHLNTDETKIYRNLIIINFVCLIMELLCTYGSMIYNDFPIISNIIYKSYLLCLLGFVYQFALYVTVIQNRNDKNKLAILLLISSILVSILPIKLVIENDFAVRYTTGPSVMTTYLTVSIYIIYIIIICLKNIKNIFVKKYVPIFALLFLGAIVLTIQFIFPQLLLYTYLTSYICVIMYFTIENPDLQMLREFHKFREISDESNKSKTSFLFNMSNQVKNPISSISTLSKEIMLENDINVIKNNVNEIIKNSTELSQIVNNVLDITDLENRKIDIRTNKYNPENLFKSINKIIEPKINSKKIKYCYHYDKSIPNYLYGDSIRLKQIMNIILDNALEYTKEGFIELNVHSVLKYDICRLIITVEDSGIGMTSDELNHLFDKEKIYNDEQLKKIDDTKNNLGIVKSLVNLMGGSIMVNSEYGKGSKFTIVIDQKIEEEIKSKTIEAVEKYEEVYINNKKILLVINSSEISKKIKKIFKTTEYSLEEVTGGQACLERLRNKEKYDLIIMEEKLEKLSSEDTLIKIKDTPGYKIPVVLLSDNKGFGAKEMYQEKGFKDVLFLPFKKYELLKITELNIKE